MGSGVYAVVAYPPVLEWMCPYGSLRVVHPGGGPLAYTHARIMESEMERSIAAWRGERAVSIAASGSEVLTLARTAPTNPERKIFGGCEE